MATVAPNASALLLDAAEGRATLLPWTVDQYHCAIKHGILDEDPGYELLDGWIVRKDRSAIGEDPARVGNRHRVSVLAVAHLVGAFKPHGCYLQSQQPIALPPYNEPEPDASIIRGTLEDHLNGPPGSADVLCVIEVADASLRRDRTVKLNAYASAKIPLYVIVNLVDNQVELYTPNASGGYDAPRVLHAADTLSLPTAAAGTVAVPVQRLLP